jgi:hypothetical protein
MCDKVDGLIIRGNQLNSKEARLARILSKSCFEATLEGLSLDCVERILSLLGKIWGSVTLPGGNLVDDRD